jgi:type II secretory pathway component PulJ
MITAVRRHRHRGRGFSLLDVAVAFTLAAFAFAGIAMFLVRLTDASNTSTARAAARRTVQAAERELDGDFADVTACGAGISAAIIRGFNTPETGGDASFGLYVRDDDGNTDLVLWRLHGGALQRARINGTADTCATLSATGATWETVLASADSSGNAAPFLAYNNGNPSAISSNCIGEGSSRCRLSAIQVNVSTRIGADSGPVPLDVLYELPRPDAL